jgi:hypothetical protein
MLFTSTRTENLAATQSSQPLPSAAAPTFQTCNPTFTGASAALAGDHGEVHQPHGRRAMTSSSSCRAPHVLSPLANQPCQLRYPSPIVLLHPDLKFLPILMQKLELIPQISLWPSDAVSYDDAQASMVTPFFSGRPPN